MLEWKILLAFAGLVATGLATLLWRGANSRELLLRGQKQELELELEAVRSELAREKKSRGRQVEELASLRKRADKAKKRSAKSAPAPLGTASRVQDLVVALEDAGRERDQIRAERDGLAGELARLESRIEVEARATQAQAQAAASEAAPPDSDSQGSDDALLAETRERLVKLENELQLAHQTQARTRKRMANQDQLYAALRGELEIKKDRLRTQEEQLQRLQALKAAVLD
jgi:chromosome segregation ATPase